VTPAAASALRDSKCCQAELDELIIKGMESAVLDVMIVGLRKMKENLSSGRRLPKPRWPRQQCPEGSVASRSPSAPSSLYSVKGS
jgi:hypothetical protein